MSIKDITSDLLALRSSLSKGEILKSSSFSFRVANTAEIVGHETLDSAKDLLILHPVQLWSSVSLTPSSLSDIYQLTTSLLASWITGASPLASICRFSGFWVEVETIHSDVSAVDDFLKYKRLYLHNFSNLIEIGQELGFLVDDDELVLRIPADFELFLNCEDSFQVNESDSLLYQLQFQLSKLISNLNNIALIGEILNQISEILDEIEQNSQLFNFFDVELDINKSQKDLEMANSLGFHKFITKTTLSIENYNYKILSLKKFTFNF
ncbi:hypothetical protein P9112_011609 [Eukaryota sp. TZLM1-RC]